LPIFSGAGKGTSGEVTDPAPITIQFTGQSTAASVNDIMLTGMVIEFLPW
jgi:hypothetical protein